MFGTPAATPTNRPGGLSPRQQAQQTMGSFLANAQGGQGSPMYSDSRMPWNQAPQGTLGQAQAAPAGGAQQGSAGFSWRDPYTGLPYSVPTMTAVTRLSPQEQQIFDANQQGRLGMAQTVAQQSGFLRDYLGQRPNLGTGAPDLQTGFRGGPITRTYSTDFSADRQRVEDALMQRMQPQIDRDRAALDTQMANQGLARGARAFSAAQDDFGRNVNDARLGAILNAGQEQSRMVGMERDRAIFQNAAQQQGFGQGMANAQMSNAARAQRMQEQYAQRMQPLNEIAALMSGGQAMIPNFQAQSPQGMPYTDNAGLINNHFNQQMQGYNAEMAAWQNTMGGLLGAGAGIISDARAKTEIKRIGETDAGVPIYTYRYIWGGPVQMGVMAQELAETQPEAVVDRGGVLAVDYAQVQ